MQTAQLVSNLLSEARKTLVGQEEPLTLLITALLCGGHVLIEGPPGTAKTLMSQNTGADDPGRLSSDSVYTRSYAIRRGRHTSVRSE